MAITEIQEIPCKKYTLEEFYALLEEMAENGEEQQLELIDGEIFPMARPGPNARHGDIVGAFTQHLRNYVKPNKLGRIYAGASCIPDPSSKNYVIPDVAFVSAERLPADFDDNGPIPVAPDLVVEVNSPTDTVEGISLKIKNYQQAGVRLIWSVYPLDNFIVVYRLGQSNKILLNLEDELEGLDVLPGFKLKVSSIFE